MKARSQLKNRNVTPTLVPPASILISAAVQTTSPSLWANGSKVAPTALSQNSVAALITLLTPQAPTAKAALNMSSPLKEAEKKPPKISRKQKLKAKRNAKSPVMQEKSQKSLVISSTVLSMKPDSSFQTIPMKTQLFTVRRLNSDAALTGTLLPKVSTSRDAQNSSSVPVMKLNTDAAPMKSLSPVDPTSKDVVSLPVPLPCTVAAKTERPLPSVLIMLDVKDLASPVSWPLSDAVLMEKPPLWARTELDVEPTASSPSMDAAPTESLSLRVLTTKDVDANSVNSDAVLMERPPPRELAPTDAQAPVLNPNMDAVLTERLLLEDPTRKDALANTLATVAALMEKPLLSDLTMTAAMTADMLSMDAVLTEKAKLSDQTIKDVLQQLCLHSLSEVLSLLRRSLLALSLKIKVMSAILDTDSSGSTMPTKEDALNSGMAVVEVTRTDSLLRKCARVSAWNLQTEEDATCQRSKVLKDATSSLLVTGTTTPLNNVPLSGGEDAKETPTTSKLGRTARPSVVELVQLKLPHQLQQHLNTPLTLLKLLKSAFIHTINQKLKDKLIQDRKLQDKKIPANLK